jgi:hypothetical protein
MKMKNRTKIIMAAGMLLLAGSANAALVELKWTTTVQAVVGEHPGISGESIITTVQVDNGGTDIYSQYYDVSNFVKFRIDGASGWWFESYTIDNSLVGRFATDAVGDVVETGAWEDETAVVNSSYISANSPGDWYLDGINYITGTVSGGVTTWLDVNNPNENLNFSNWTASAASTTPVTEPSVFALFGLGLVGIGFARRRRS